MKPDKDILLKLYLDEHLTQAEIGKRCGGVTRQAVSLWFREYGLEAVLRTQNMSKAKHGIISGGRDYPVPVDIPMHQAGYDLVADGATDWDACPTRLQTLCHCKPCIVCGFGPHMAIHGPVSGQPSGSNPYGHPYTLTLIAQETDV
jgi:hypothetical protein